MARYSFDTYLTASTQYHSIALFVPYRNSQSLHELSAGTVSLIELMCISPANAPHKVISANWMHILANSAQVWNGLIQIQCALKV